MLERTARDDDAAAHVAIENAGVVLAARRDDVPANFIEQIYGHAVPEDVMRYGADDLAMLAERRREAWRVTHPVLGVRREGGKLAALGAADAANATRESFINIHLAPIEDDAARADLVAALEGVLGEVRLAVQDWRPMRDRVSAVVAELKTNPPPLPVDEIAEAIQFLQWLLADNFTLLGLRDYVFDGQALTPDFDGALGIMRARELRVLRRGKELFEFTPEIMAFLQDCL